VDYLFSFLKGKQTRLFDHTKTNIIANNSNSPLASFAVDDALATSVGNEEAPLTFRLWQHEQSVILGIPDSRLPFIEHGISFLLEEGYRPIIRSSGGLAVVLDDGVLNLSMILPNAKSISINVAYQLMYNFIQQLFSAYTSDIQAYEIIGSYCPGDFDLSINGKKFAGISQRRVRNGVAIQIYIDISGASQKKASLIKRFYEISKREAVTSFQYPHINIDVMSSINELLSLNLTVDDVIHKVEKFLDGYTDLSKSTILLDKEKSYFIERLKQMENRNKKLKEGLND